MPVFQYMAVTNAGKEVSGTTEAPDEQSAIAALRKQSWMVLDLKPVAAKKKEPKDAQEKRKPMIRQRAGWVRERDRIHFFRQMALMIRSGLTLLQALQVCGRQSSRARLARCIERISASIQSGQSLSAAMAREDKQFQNLTVKLVESSEATGELDPVLEEVADLLERKVRLRANLLTSLLYPAIVFIVSVAVAVFLMVSVIPKFAGFFAQKNVELPATTKALLDISAWFREYGIYVLAVIAMGLIALAITAAFPKGRQWFDHMVLRVPVVGNLLLTAAMSRLSTTLSSLVRSGVTLLESLRITQGVLGNHAVATRVEDTADRILRGENLAAGLSMEPIPPLVSQVIGVGERSGALTKALEDLGKFYERELEASIQRMSAAVEPVMILILGGMVGFVYIAFFQAVFQLVSA